MTEDNARYGNRSEQSSKEIDRETVTERCDRCRCKLDSHGKAWIDGDKHYICPTTDGVTDGPR